MTVLDANILIRAVLGRRARQLVETYSAQGFQFFAPAVASQNAITREPLPAPGTFKADFQISAARLSRLGLLKWIFRCGEPAAEPCRVLCHCFK